MSADEPHGLGRFILQHVGMVGHTTSSMGASVGAGSRVSRWSWSQGLLPTNSRIEVTAAGHLNPAGVVRCQACQGYCLSQTVTLLVAWPCAFVPLVVKVKTFPSLETTRGEV